jgi:hypothetical protein
MPTREQMIAEIRAAKQGGGSPEAPSREQMIAEIRAAKAPASEDEGGGVLSDVAGGLNSAIRTYDSYMGAPARAGIGALQEGKGLSGAAAAFGKQFGANPDQAPKGGDIRKKAGVDLGDGTALDPNHPIVKYIPQTPTGYLLKEALTRISPNDLVDFAIESGADLTNLIPVAGITKRAVKGGVEATEAALRSAGKAVQKTGDVAGKLGKKVISGALGPSEEGITKYLAGHERMKDIVDVKSGLAPLKDDMDAALQPLTSRVGAAKERVGVAKERRTEELSRLTDAQREAKERLRLAESQRMGETAARVSGDVQKLNKDVSAGSEKAFQILDEEGVKVPVTHIKGELSKAIKSLSAKAVTDEQIAVVDLVRRYRTRLDKFGKDIAGGDAKRLIQALDREMNHLAPGEVGRMAKDDQFLGQLRRRFDAPLKASPAYAKQMEGVAKDTRLLRGAEDMATESGAARALQASRLPTGKDRADVLRLLGERQGQDYLAAIDRATLPEYQKLKGVLMRVREARKGGEFKAAQMELDSAMAELAPFKSVAPNEFGKSGAEALIRNQLRPKTAGMDQAALVKQLDQKFGKNYTQRIDDLRTVAEFDKEFTRGSANTNFWAIAAGAVGGAFGLGPVGGAIGAAGGAALGRVAIDRFGPQAARVILDQIPKLKRMAPKDWISHLQVPDSVKAALTRDLIHQNLQRSARAGAAVTKPLRDVSAGRMVAEDKEGK